MKVQVIIPFRDRGIDPRRGANLDVVTAWWFAHGWKVKITDDGLEGDAQFNRHRAYNLAVSRNPADVYVFTEADMLIHPDQIKQAVEMAAERPGLVVPFTQYRYLSDSTTDIIREVYNDRGVAWLATWWARAADDPRSVFGLTPESIMDNGRSIGAVNVLSNRTLQMTGGFTELTSGNWYDDNIINEGFAFLTDMPTRYIFGPAVHLYHLPGHKGDHLTEADKAATEYNRQVLQRMRDRIRCNQPEAVRDMMQYRSKGK
jgi:hypothetical protein